jgi:hypothetical protein
MYTHTQRGHLVIVILFVVAAVFAGLQMAGLGSSTGVWVGLVAIAAVGFLFGSLTTEVDHERFAFWFGPGVLRHSYHLSEIQSCTAVTNPWWYGVGIHLTPDGWLYNVSGRKAVQITLVSGRRFRVGTDEPEDLCRVIHTRKGIA